MGPETLHLDLNVALNPSMHLSAVQHLAAVVSNTDQVDRHCCLKQQSLFLLPHVNTRQKEPTLKSN
jgi:hypothetical protein